MSHDTRHDPLPVEYSLLRRAKKAEAEVDRYREALLEITRAEADPNKTAFHFEQHVHRIATVALYAAVGGDLE